LRLLLDTHVLLWWLQDAPGISAATREAIAQRDALVHVSAASVWEAAIKVSLGKLRVERNLPETIPASGFIDLPIAARHAWLAGSLPPLHADPFDRILVAQAKLEELTLVTHDRALREYGIPILAA
jgi:PIN domain nuclease of toxin-antitoxin system